MPQHLRHALCRHAIEHSEGGGKGVTGDMESERFTDAAQISYLLEVGVHLLVTQHRQQLIFVLTVRVVPVLLQFL